MKDCVECGTPFTFRTHNQKYCSKECCRIATNKKIMAKYYLKKQRLSGQIRLCEGCGNGLSRYNPDNLCTKCQQLQKKNKSKEVIGDIENVISKLSKAKSK